MGHYHRLRLVVALFAVTLFVFNITGYLWGWQLVAGAPHGSGRLLTAFVLNLVRFGEAPLSNRTWHQENLEQWHGYNPDALGALIVIPTGEVWQASPSRLVGEIVPISADVVDWMVSKLGAERRSYAAVRKTLVDAGGDVLGEIVAVVPDVAYTNILSRVYFQALMVNPLWLILYWVAIPTWVYLDALAANTRRKAVRWALVVLPLNLLGLAAYLMYKAIKKKRVGGDERWLPTS